MTTVDEALFFSSVAYTYTGTQSKAEIDNSLKQYVDPSTGVSYFNSGWSCLKLSEPNSNSYYGLAFKRTDGAIVIANRGSFSAQDWSVTDKDIVEQIVAPAFTDALNFANEIAANNPNSSIVCTGHSLGGAEAQYVAASLPGTASPSGITFSAPGVQWAKPGVTANVTNYVFAGEPIGQFGSHIGNLVLINPDLSKRVEGWSVFVSTIVDALLPQPLPAAVGLVGPYWDLHLIENYEEYYGITPVPGASGSVGGPEGVMYLVSGLAADIAAGIVEPQSTLPVSIGGTATISHDFLWSSEVFKTPDQLTYTITDQPAHGLILDNGVAAASFTQADIDDGLVKYVQNGDGATSDSFIFMVSDPAGNHTPIEGFNIAIVDRPDPVVSGSPLSVAAGDVRPLDNRALDTVSLGSTPDQMGYTLLLPPEHGLLVENGMPATNFTQADIDKGSVMYVQNGSPASADLFLFQVSDASGASSGPQPFFIQIQGSSDLVLPSGGRGIDPPGNAGGQAADQAFTFDDVSPRIGSTDADNALTSSDITTASGGTVQGDTSMSDLLAYWALMQPSSGDTQG